MYRGVLGPTLILVVLMAALAVVSVTMLGAVRGYVAGESLWSKARSEAVQHLREFATTHNPASFQAFEQALAIPLGDRLAREEMSRRHTDKALVRSGLSAGGNHPDDIANMALLFQYFGDQWVFQDALTAWIHGDALIDELRTLGHQLHAQINAGANPSSIAPTLARLHTLNQQLSQVEKQFSAHLGTASRRTEQLLIGGVLLLAAGLSLGCTFVVRRTLGRQSRNAQTLAAANERWELAASVAGLGLFQVDMASDSVELDGKAASLYGRGNLPLWVPRASLRAQMPDTDRAQSLSEIASAVESGKTFKLKSRVQWPDGSMHWLEALGRLDGPGTALTATTMVGVLRDVTDETAQAQLAMQRDAAEKVALAQRAFLSRLSHELRTPLNAILGFAQLLVLDQSQPLPAGKAQQVQLILTAGQQLLALVEDVLDLSKVEAGEINLSIQTVDVWQVLNSSIQLIDNARQHHDVTVLNKVPTQTFWVQADPNRLQQVFINLLTNGCKYNRSAGHLTIDARAQAHDVVIEFSDNGIGISPEDASELFQPFKRIKTYGSDIEGTGLGLYIVKQLIERMAGTVSVSSQKGVGSRFTVTLPARN